MKIINTIGKDFADKQKTISPKYILVGIREWGNYGNGIKIAYGKESTIREFLTPLNLYAISQYATVLFLIRKGGKYHRGTPVSHYFFNYMKKQQGQFKSSSSLVAPIVGILDIRARMRDEGLLKEWTQGN